MNEKIVTLIWKAIDNAFEDGSISYQDMAEAIDAPIPDDSVSQRIVKNAFVDHVSEMIDFYKKIRYNKYIKKRHLQKLIQYIG